MSTNWIVHALSTTPEIITNEDVTRVPVSRLQEFYSRVQKELLYGAMISGGSLPFALQERIARGEAEHMATILEEALHYDDVMDSGWINDYFRICDQFSRNMSGYPKRCCGEWRALKNSYAGCKRVKLPPPPSTTNKKTEVKQLFRFLDLPIKIRSRIYALLLPCESFTVSDWALDSKPRVYIRRTEYDVVDWNERKRRTTYIVLSSARAHLNLMLVNRLLYQELGERLSECRLDFRGSEMGTLAFLHDNLNPLASMKKISLRYTTTTNTPFMGCTSGKTARAPRTLKTNFQDWRKIIKVLRYSATGLEDVDLIIDKNFWNEAPWDKGVSAILSATALCETPKGKSPVVKNFLSEIAKLSAVNFRLSIENSEGSEMKKRFARDLGKAICKLIDRNPYLAEKGTMCMCRKRLLSEACVYKDGWKRACI